MLGMGSDSGWGLACTTDESLQSHGFGSQEKRSLHINAENCMLCLFAWLFFFARRQHYVNGMPRKIWGTGVLREVYGQALCIYRVPLTLRWMHCLEGTILVINGCSIMTCSPGSVRFSQVLPLTCLRQLWTIVYLIMFHGVTILKLFQLIPLIFHGKGKRFMPFLHLVWSYVAWKKWSLTKRKEC